MPRPARTPHSVPPRRRAHGSACVAGARLALALALAACGSRGARASAGMAPRGAYTPAQIRQAYEEPALPAHWHGLRPSQAAAFGAGQTIYVFDLYDDPELAAEINDFSRSFGLPGCAERNIPVDSVLPLPAASPGAGCTFSMVHANASAGMRSRAPAYDPRWQDETAADLEWAHASAPLARLIEVDSAPADWASALELIDRLGPGVVSMSMIVPEGAAMRKRMFDNANMSYLAGTGDSGSQVNWPAVLPQVLGVGGTVLRSYTANARDETVWANAGGGISRYIAAPGYQARLGLGMRSVPDVAMNAGYGQAVLRIPPAASSPSGRDICQAPPGTAIPAPGMSAYASAPAGRCAPVWTSIVGTSLATPEWAGILAVADAERALSGRGVLGEVQPLLYALLRRPRLYARMFQDITSGGNGHGPHTRATTGFDTPSGLGTPKVGALLAYLRDSPEQVAPIVSPLSVEGEPSRELSFSVPLSAVEPVRWSLSGAPRGMRIGASTGVVSWQRPRVGTYRVQAIATDPRTSLRASAMLRLRIASSRALTIASAGASALD